MTATHRRCDGCGLDPSQVTAPDALVALRSFPRRWRALFAGLDDEDTDARALIGRRPEPATWSALEYAAHVADVLRLYDEWVRRVLVEDRPSLPGVDPDRWADDRRYADQRLPDVLDGLEAAAGGLADRLQQVEGESWERRGVREGEDVSVLWMARQAVHEGAHHLRDAERSLSAATSDR